MKAITLKAGREKSALRYHPWIFSGAVDEVVGDPELGDTVEVYSYRSDFLGLAAYSPKSQIRGRFWTFGEKAHIDREFFSDILDRAIAARKSRGGIGVHLAIGIAIAFSFIVFMKITTVFATNGDLSPFMAVMLPQIVFGIAAAWLIYKAPK